VVITTAHQFWQLGICLALFGNRIRDVKPLLITTYFWGAAD